MNRPWPILSPNTGRVFDTWTPTQARDMECALEASDNALARLRDRRERVHLLAACESALRARREQLAGIVVREVGKKPREAQDEVEYAAGFFRAARMALDELELEHRPGDGREIREAPYGVALLIAPFNDPLAGLARKIAPAIAAGAPAMVKPSRLGILSAAEFMNALADAGAEEVVRLVAPEDSRIVAGLLADRRVGVVSFTGSTEIGQVLAAQAAREGKKAILELGGNCPFVVLEDADLGQALEDLLARKLRCAGQACSSVNRVLVAATRLDAFRDALMDRVSGLVVGPSEGPGVDLGPVRTREAVASLRDLVAAAEQRGERLLNGLPVISAPDQPFLAPLSIVESTGSSVFDRRESFGPALSIRPFACLEDCLGRLERERQALAIYFHTGEPARLLPRLDRLRFGSIGINTTSIQDPAVPTGGFWSAGMGREGGTWGVREFLAPINLRVRDASRAAGRQCGQMGRRDREP